MEKARIPIVEDEAIIAMEIESQLQILCGFSLRYFDHSQLLRCTTVDTNGCSLIGMEFPRRCCIPSGITGCSAIGMEFKDMLY